MIKHARYYWPGLHRAHAGRPTRYGDAPANAGSVVKVHPITGVLIEQLDEGPTKTEAEQVYVRATTSVLSARDVYAVAAAVSAPSPE